MNEDKFGWGMSDTDPMIAVITYEGKRVMSISIGEAMESAGRAAVMKHVRECDSSPWLRKWHDDKMDQEISVLRGESP